MPYYATGGLPVPNPDYKYVANIVINNSKTTGIGWKTVEMAKKRIYTSMGRKHNSQARTSRKTAAGSLNYTPSPRKSLQRIKRGMEWSKNISSTVHAIGNRQDNQWRKYAHVGAYTCPGIEKITVISFACILHFFCSHLCKIVFLFAIAARIFNIFPNIKTKRKDLVFI